MKSRFTSKKVAIALALATIPILVGCGSNSSSATTAAASSLYYESGGCIPITQPIYFSGTGVNLSSQTLVAGTIPAADGGQTNGTVTVGTTPISATTVGGETFVSNDMSYGQYAYGDISVTLTGMTNGYYASSGTIYGTITISPVEQQNIEQYAESMGIYGTTSTAYGSIPCVSGIALQGYLDSTPSAPGFEGYAYVYIDNQPHGVTLQFSGVN
jgi:hypothetical protein